MWQRTVIEKGKGEVRQRRLLIAKKSGIKYTIKEQKSDFKNDKALKCVEMNMVEEKKEEKKQEEISENKEQTSESKKTDEQNTELLETSEKEEPQKESGRYEMLTELAPNLWTYGSPVLFTSGVLEKDTISQKNRLTLKFVNIYEQAIRDVYISIMMGDIEEPEVLEHSYLALGQDYLMEKGRTAKITIPNEEARVFRIRIDKVVFEDGSVWNKQDAVLESAGEMEDFETFAQAKLKDYEDNYISATEEIAKDDSESIGNGMEIIKRIPWYKDSAELYRDAKRKYGILKQNEERKKAGVSKREDRKKMMHKRFIKSAVIILVLAGLCVAGYFFFIVPNNSLKEAKKNIKEEKYDAAIAKLEKLDGFLNSEKYLSAAYFTKAQTAYNSGNIEEAKSYFQKSYDADKDTEDGIKAKAYLDYYDGVQAIEDGDYEKAQKLLQSSKDSIGNYNLVNNIDVRLSELYYLQKNYEAAWKSIINLYAKNADDQEISSMYCTYGEAYAKKLIADGKRSEGMEIYGKVQDNPNYKGASLSNDWYQEAVKLAEQGKIDEALNILKDIKDYSPQAKKLYTDINRFEETVKYWLGTWKHRVKSGDGKQRYTIVISQVLYKGEMCLKIKDQNNKKLGFETIISKKNHVTQISIGQFIIHFKLKKFSNQKFTYTIKPGNKMERKQKYGKETYKSTYKRKSKQ